MGPAARLCGARRVPRERGEPVRVRRAARRRWSECCFFGLFSRLRSPLRPTSTPHFLITLPSHHPANFASHRPFQSPPPYHTNPFYSKPFRASPRACPPFSDFLQTGPSDADLTPHTGMDGAVSPGQWTAPHYGEWLERVGAWLALELPKKKRTSEEVKRQHHHAVYNQTNKGIPSCTIAGSQLPLVWMVSYACGAHMPHAVCPMYGRPNSIRPPRDNPRRRSFRRPLVWDPAPNSLTPATLL